MTEAEIKQLLLDVGDRRISVDEAWNVIDAEREMPNEYSKEFWLPIKAD